MRVWMNYASASLTAIYRIGNFKEKKKKRTFASPPPYIGRVFPMPFAR